MKAVVMDTNVPVSANGMANHISEDCVINCANRLKQVRTKVEFICPELMGGD